MELIVRMRGINEDAEDPQPEERVNELNTSLVDTDSEDEMREAR